MHDACRAKAGSLEAAAIQMRVIRNYSTLDGEDAEKAEGKIRMLIFSVLGVLEGQGGFGRHQWAGDYYLGGHDPFDRIEA